MCYTNMYDVYICVCVTIFCKQVPLKLAERMRKDEQTNGFGGLIRAILS